ncbi:MAG: FlgD immunoglobulin-like domain containing protein [Calditrichia bacterium]
MPNQKQYFRLSTRYWGQYLRIDTSELKVKCYDPVLAPDSELIYFDLHPTGNYSGNSGYTVYVDSGFGQVGLLPCSEKYYSYFWNDGFTRNFKLSQNYEISYWDLRELMGFQGILITAEIDGIQYGQFVGLQKKHSLPSNKLAFFNYPNPFNATTTIRYDIPEAAVVRLAVYDLVGQHVKTLVDTYQPAGRHKTSWNGLNKHNLPAATGLYLCCFEARDYHRVIKFMLVK